jgi:hypothetical protein
MNENDDSMKKSSSFSDFGSERDDDYEEVKGRSDGGSGVKRKDWFDKTVVSTSVDGGSGVKRKDSFDKMEEAE